MTKHLQERRYALLGIALPIIAVVGATCTTTPTDPTGQALAILESDQVLGSADAAVTVVEYGSLHCSWCGLFARQDFPTIKAQYIDTGRVRWVFRHYVSMNDSASVLAACATECAADQGRYYDYLTLIFQNQGNQTVEVLKQHATTLGLDRTTFDACLDGGGKVDRVGQDVSSATALGVNSTPRFFVDSEQIRGYQTAAQLSAILDRHLAGV